MTGSFVCNKWKLLLSCLLFLLSLGNTNIYGFERGPIYKGGRFVDSPLPFYRENPQIGCEYAVTSQKDYYFPNYPNQSEEILSVSVISADLGGWPIPRPAPSFLCFAKISRKVTGSPQPTIYDTYVAGGVYAVCNIGDNPHPAITDATVCNIPNSLPDKGVNAGQPQADSCAGNPVNTATGNKYAEETDIANSGGLSFSRYYNAVSLSGGSSAGSSWNHSFQRSLYVNPQTITATRPDGRTAYFRLIGSVWVNQQAGGDTLTQISGGSGWQLTTSDDVIETYNTSGKLLSITDRNDRTQTLSYDANGRLTAVTDDTGRVLSFTYDGSSRIQTMTDPANGVTQYTYDTAGNLTAVIYPDGKTRTYHYNEQAYTSNTNLPNALTGITDENGARYATYTYDTQGRAVVTEHAVGWNAMCWDIALMAAAPS